MALKVALVGYGLAGRVFHAPLITACPQLALATIVTANAQRAAAAAIDHPRAEVVPTLTDALATRPDVVVIASANRVHAEQAQASLAGGAHVIVDKPVGVTADEATEIQRASQRAHRLAIPFQNRRWDSDFLTLRNIVATQELGALHRFESRIERMKLELSGSWRESAADAGGVLLDFGAHLVDQAIELMGPVIRVNAYSRSVRAAEIANDDASIELEHESGALSVLVCSQVAALSGPRSLLLGTRGAVVQDVADGQEAQLRAGRTPADINWGVEPANAVAIMQLGDTPQVRVPYERGRWDVFYPSIADAITSSTAPPVSMDDVIANMRVLDAAAQSATENARVTVHAAHV